MISSAKFTHSSQTNTHRNPSWRFYRRRRGVYMLELILILPIILLVSTILYQVSIMMTTCQALKTTCFNATIACTKTVDEASIEDVIASSIQGYYFKDCSISRVNNNNDWENDVPSCVLKYRILTYDGTKWSYLPNSTFPVAGTTFAVELKLAGAEHTYPNYWLLSHFIGVDATKSAQMVFSQISAK